MPSDFNVSENLKKNLMFLGLTLLLSATIVGAHNLTMDEDVPDIGFMELEVDCKGIDTFVCLGIQVQEHTPLYYGEWYEEGFDGIEEGTDEHRRMVETELMVRAYDECQNLEHEDMDWTSEVEFEGMTAEEWQDENDEITLLPCEETYRFSIEDERP